jgi:ribonuclease BN (tRNA processing enzyme)
MKQWNMVQKPQSTLLNCCVLSSRKLLKFSTIKTLNNTDSFMKILISLTAGLLLSSAVLADMKIILLGTGTPHASPEASGPATAVIVDGKPWIVDAGPGVVRRASAAHIKGEKALTQPNLSRVLITHLHSDHTLGLPDIMYSPWTLDRVDPIQIWGPPGTKAMVQHIEAAYSLDLKMRLDGAEPANTTGWKSHVEESKGGIIYKDDTLTIEAIPVCHGDWDVAFGYKFTHGSKTAVISGDTTYCPALEQAAQNADVLIHEVYDSAALAKRKPEWQNYHSKAHTASEELGTLATNARVKSLILYHQLTYSGSKEAILKQVSSTYKGPITWGTDLMVIDLK